MNETHFNTKRITLAWPPLFIKLMATICLIGTAACQKSVRNTVYNAYEVVGVQKRDLVKRRVDHARDEQEEAAEDFKDALSKLKEITKFQGGELEKKYDELKESYERSKDQAGEVHKSIRSVETVAGDLFEEWESELQEISTPSLRESSRKTLEETKARYADLHKSLKKSEARMEPVLVKFNDQVLFLKHNLDARAFASLKSEAVSIESDIARLIKEMNQSIAQAEEFIAKME